MIAMVLSAAFHSSQGADDHGAVRNDWKVVVRLYRGPFLVILFIFLVGINVHGWRSAGVNHVLIFELDPRNHLSGQHLLELAAIFGVFWTLSILSFLYSAQLCIPAYANPLSLFIVMTIFMLNPTRTLKHEARFWFLKIAQRILMAPFFSVNFADFWLADQLNSLGQALKDFQFLICFYIISKETIDDDWEKASSLGYCSSTGWWLVAVVACMPAWFRFAQCLRRYLDTREAFPHLVNAGKYSTTFFTVIFSTLDSVYRTETDKSAFFYFYILSAITSSCYTYTWDIKMDWGFFSPAAGDNKYLREELVYSRNGYYYFAIVEDLVLRFSWAYTLVLKEGGLGEYAELTTSVFSVLEVVRRFIWNFFRLENEHLNNCGKFRAVRDISVARIAITADEQRIRSCFVTNIFTQKMTTWNDYFWKKYSIV